MVSSLTKSWMLDMLMEDEGNWPKSRRKARHFYRKQGAIALNPKEVESDALEGARIDVGHGFDGGKFESVSKPS